MRVFVLLALAIVVAGPAFADQPPAQPATSETKSPASQPLYKSIWRRDDKGNIAHLQSGLSCDAQVADFRRVGVRAYAPSGLDVSCDYLDAQRTLITLYLTRRGTQTTADDMAEAKREFLAAHADANELASPSPPAAGLPFETAFYKLAQQGDRVREGIWIGDLNGWTLEYRATWTPGDEAATFAEIGALTANVQKTAGALLALCSKSPPPVRNGAAIADRKELESELMMQSLMGAAGIAAVADQAAKPGAAPLESRPRTWCAEGIAGKPDDGLLLWRAVNPDGTDAAADRITPATIEVPAEIVSESDPLAALVDGEAKPGQKARWTVSITDNGQVSIYAIFSGRPSAADLAMLAADIGAGKVKPVGGYKVNGKNITISMPPDH